MSIEHSTMDQYGAFIWVPHVASLAAIAAAFAGFIPAIAAVVAIIWYTILILESATMKQWRAERAIKKLAKLRAKEKVLLARMKHDGKSPEDNSTSAL